MSRPPIFGDDARRRENAERGIGCKAVASRRRTHDECETPAGARQLLTAA
jgi:hypothetical protein